MTADPGVVLDASALVAYAQDDLLSLPVDELLQELREDTGGAVHIPGLAHADAVEILDGDKPATARLESFAAAHGVLDAPAGERDTIGRIVTETGVSAGMAHAMLLAARLRCLLATYAAPTLARAGFDAQLVLDLDEFFRLR